MQLEILGALGYTRGNKGHFGRPCGQAGSWMIHYTTTVDAPPFISFQDVLFHLGHSPPPLPQWFTEKYPAHRHSEFVLEVRASFSTSEELQAIELDLCKARWEVMAEGLRHRKLTPECVPIFRAIFDL